MKEVDKAWAAGFFDGEGTVGIYKSTTGRKYHTHRASIRVSGCNPEPLHKLQSLFGGTVKTQSHANQYGKGWRKAYVWVLCGVESIKTFIEYTRPYLLVKKDEVDVLTEFFTTILQNRNVKGHQGTVPVTYEVREYREKLKLRLQELKKRSY